MKKLFAKHEFLICMLLIIIYVVVNSFCIQNYGILNIESVLINTLYSFCLLLLVYKLDKVKYYGLVKPRKIKRFIYFLPLLLIMSTNLWNGINIQNEKDEILFYILNMINIGFIEEIIFRGFLFKMMEKDNLKSAIIVSSITFGIGHIINLFNGQEIIQTIFQVCYAISIGYLFVIIFYKSKSLIPCIVTHIIVNSLSIFNVDNIISLYISPLFLIIVPFIYARYLLKQ